jgi:hypothetical protein
LNEDLLLRLQHLSLRDSNFDTTVKRLYVSPSVYGDRTA